MYGAAICAATPPDVAESFHSLDSHPFDANSAREEMAISLANARLPDDKMERSSDWLERAALYFDCPQEPAELDALGASPTLSFQRMKFD
jgi:hypothetical protein